MHRPKKRFGQNFLQDSQVVHSILRLFNPQPDDKVIEIGPGLGALTHPLLQIFPHFTAIEIDHDLHAYWLNKKQQNPGLNLIQADALTVDFGSLGTKLRIIGNLPYNISTPLLLHLLSFKEHIKDMHFMLQKEVALRLAALPGNKDYGRLSVLLQYICEVEYLLEVPAHAFHPKPKVESAVVRLTPHISSAYADVELANLQHLLKQAFAMRRKTLANNLKSIISAQDLTQLNIDPSIRPEQLSIEEYVKLAKFITK